MNKTLWVMAGLPGSGKSTFAQKFLMKGNNWAYVSRDVIRFSIIKNDDEYFSHEKEVFRQFVKQINKFLSDDIHTDVIADATHISWASRNKLLNQLNLSGVKINIVWMDTVYQTCLERNAKREGRARVPDSAMESMYRGYTHPREDNFPYHNIYNVKEDGRMYRERRIFIE